MNVRQTEGPVRWGRLALIVGLLLLSSGCASPATREPATTTPESSCKDLWKELEGGGETVDPESSLEFVEARFQSLISNAHVEGPTMSIATCGELATLPALDRIRISGTSGEEVRSQQVRNISTDEGSILVSIYPLLGVETHGTSLDIHVDDRLVGTLRLDAARVSDLLDGCLNLIDSVASIDCGGWTVFRAQLADLDASGLISLGVSAWSGDGEGIPVLYHVRDSGRQDGAAEVTFATLGRGGRIEIDAIDALTGYTELEDPIVLVVP